MARRSLHHRSHLHRSLLHRIGDDVSEIEGREAAAIAIEELVLELDPLEAKSVEERGEVLHHHEDYHRDDSPRGVAEPREDAREDRVVGEGEADADEDHILEELGQLRVREREGPEAQVGGGLVRLCTPAESYWNTAMITVRAARHMAAVKT